MKYVNFCFAAIVLFALMSSSVKSDRIAIGYFPGDELPNFSFSDSDGRNFDLHGYRGKKVVVNFWAINDARSRATNVQLHNFLVRNFPDVEMISICFDENEQVFERTVLLDQLGNHSQFCDVEGARSEVFRNFRLYRGFRNFLLDENGVVVAIDLTPERLREIL
jgi:peroxiredoxin